MCRDSPSTNNGWILRPYPSRGWPVLHQFRFPRSKRRRIRKKWARREENFRKVYLPQFRAKTSEFETVSPWFEIEYTTPTARAAKGEK